MSLVRLLGLRLGIVLGCILGAPLAIAVEAKTFSAANLMDVCSLKDVETATTRGDELGWQRQVDVVSEKWRQNVIAVEKANVQSVAWRGTGQRDTFNFYVVDGTLARRSCSYAGAPISGVFEALVARYGSPAGDPSVIAVWQLGTTRISYINRPKNMIFIINEYDRWPPQ